MRPPIRKVKAMTQQREPQDTCPVCANRMRGQMERLGTYWWCEVCGFRGLEVAKTASEVAELHRRRDAALRPEPVAVP